MTQYGFDRWAELAKRLVQLDDLKEWIVAKAVRACWLKTNSAATGRFAIGGDVSIPQNTIVAKELAVKGSFRFHEEFAVAARMIESRRIDVRPLLSDVLPLAQAEIAFKLASDRKRAMKVQIDFSG